MMNYQKRLFKLKKKLKRLKLDSFIVLNRENIRYFCGFTGSIAVLLIYDNVNYLIVDSRYTDQAKLETKNVKVIELQPGESHFDLVSRALKRKNISSVGFEEGHFNLKSYLKLTKEFEKISFKPAGHLVEELREIKDKEEIKNIKLAVKIAEEAFGRVKNILAPGIEEKKIALELIFAVRELGGVEAFEPIVSSGKRTALPHAISSSKALEEGDTVIIDFGATVNGYSSDITRTVVLGQPSSKQKVIYDIVRKAQISAIRKISAGRTCEAIDVAARGIIKKRKLEKNFKHGTGHGIGLSVHELPRLTFNNKGKLSPGMVLTIEPGIYINGWGGMRVEDMALVTKKGHEILTNLPRELTL
ncbi:MAG: Xaa-Pro peptidase family protein [Candidatus Saganbacteria bacterium]|nr:Xaa-Pro peptidase family protein [Candidatus Saganbacteria bacterium]